jgi:hypothetical protein
VRQKLDSNPAAKQRLKDAMEGIGMGEDGGMSTIDAVSLANWLPQVLPDIKRRALEDTNIEDLKKLGEWILT